MKKTIVFRREIRLLPVTAQALSVVLIAGCTSFIPTYERPAAPVALTYPQAPMGPGSADASPAAEIEWQRFFGDPQLKQLIALSLQNNRDLRVAVLNIEQARAAYQIKRADELPLVGAGISAQRLAGSSGALANVYAVGLQVTAYELDFFGRVRSLSQAALSQFLATEEARKTAQIALVSGVATLYLNLLADDELLRVTRAALATREDSFRLTRLRFDNGVSSEVDLRQAEQLLETAKAALAQTQRQRALDENALTLLVGQPLPTAFPTALPTALSPELPLAEQPSLTALPAGLPSDLLARRPDVRSAEQQLMAANANIGAARAAFFPRIALTANAGTASTELSGLFKSGSFALTGTAALLQPIFEAGRNQANLAVARVNKNIAIAQYEKAIQTAFREVSDALAGRTTLGEQLRAQVAVADAAQVSFKLADLRYRSGVSSYFDVLDAQRSLFTAQQATVQTQALRAQNIVTLYKVLGGGWTEP
jgi:outer membrane protein, multidrug efflux system